MEAIPDQKTTDKLIDLASRAISINEKLLVEEKSFVNTLSQSQDLEGLQGSIEKINLLMRKEVLYNQAAQMLLRKVAVTF